MKRGMTQTNPIFAASHTGFDWALQMKATTMDEPSRLIQTLTSDILSNGGWVLSRGADTEGLITMLFEFERQSCVDIYTTLISAGVELSQLGHFRFTELCQCTRSHWADCGGEIVSIDLEIRSFPPEAMRPKRSVAKPA